MGFEIARGRAGINPVSAVSPRSRRGRGCRAGTAPARRRERHCPPRGCGARKGPMARVRRGGRARLGAQGRRGPSRPVDRHPADGEPPAPGGGGEGRPPRRGQDEAEDGHEGEVCRPGARGSAGPERAAATRQSASSGMAMRAEAGGTMARGRRRRSPRRMAGPASGKRRTPARPARDVERQRRRAPASSALGAFGAFIAPAPFPGRCGRPGKGAPRRGRRLPCGRGENRGAAIGREGGGSVKSAAGMSGRKGVGRCGADGWSARAR